MSLNSFFPFDSIRPNQKRALDDIDQALKSGYKFIFLEAPTGFGKSAVAVALSRFLGSSIFGLQQKIYKLSILEISHIYMR